VEESIQQMTAAIASGDTEAFARFYRARFDSMYAEARRSTRRDEAFCLDVVQDAMMRVIKSMSPMESEGSLRAWLRAVVQCCAYDRIRAESRRARRERAAAQDRPAERAAVDDLEERLAWLRHEWADLDQQQARLLVMRYRFGWTLRRIGEALGLKPGAVDGRLTRAVGELRSRAQEHFHER
jgi:RNA polymerase sigma factor (sigma-70 family)